MLENSIIKALGGGNKIRETLTNAIAEKRDHEKISFAEVDKMCCFASHAPSLAKMPLAPFARGKDRPSREYPSWKNVEKDFTLLRSYIFSPVSYAVGVSLEDAIGKKWLRKLDTMYKDIATQKENIPYELARGTEGDAVLSDKERFLVYAYTCILRSLDEEE